jgi:hypothetical protein
VTKISGNLILRGACAFAIAFAIAGAARGFAAGIMHYKPYVQQVYTVLMVGAIFYAVMGGLAVMSIRVKLQPDKRAQSFYLKASIVCGFAFFTTTGIIYWYSFTDRLLTFQAIDIANTLQFAFIGACIGALLGSYKQDRRLIIWLAVVGAIGFSIHGLTRLSPGTLLSRLGFFIDLYGARLGFAMMILASFAVRDAITGMVGGALIGWALRNHRKNESRA